MYFKWPRIWNGHRNADLGRNRATSMSAFYDRTVRTKSYNDIVVKLDLLTAQSKADNANVGLQSFVPTERLLEPSQETVDMLLHNRTESESPEMMKMANDFFESSSMASMLCSTILYCVDQARGQWGCMDEALAEFPRSGETLGFTQQRLISRGFLDMLQTGNPFADVEASEMFTNVRGRYSLLSEEVDEKRRVVGRKTKALRRWRGGCIGMTVAMVAGATLVVVVVTMHMVVGIAAVPMLLAAAAVARSKFHQTRESVGKGCRPRGGPEVDVDDGRRMDGNGVVAMARNLSATARRSHLDAAGASVEVASTQTEREVAVAARWGSRRAEWWCWGLPMLAGQSAKLDALAYGIFLVRKMLDTLRCLVTGLEEDWEHNRRLIEFGWMHHEETVCVQQVGRQLLRSHIHLVRQLGNVQEQVAVCCVLINKARRSVLQEFSAVEA